MRNNPVRWFEIYVQDMKRAKAFYEAVLAIKLEKLPDPGPGISEMMTFPSEKEAFGATGALVKMDGGPSDGNSVIIYFGCEDCSVESKRAASHGGKVMKDKFSIGRYGFISHVTDPEGNMIGLHSLK